jgi:hypothetical protein
MPKILDVRMPKIFCITKIWIIGERIIDDAPKINVGIIDVFVKK